ncbi:hypothetical protein [Streptomyces meridianus]|uniref:Uncharacterized protein n=1 Tax=Streptomyces meridianus TaxID=2938945 RepID=A0ABT0X6J9_9ACTN|nr:hypothetical protein [Streptomyces meridianus]MCM2577925.1 hypothetical protein [Streptomyces meridianus]
MSWDLLLMPVPDENAVFDELPEDGEGPSLGRRAQVLAALAGTMPDADLSDPAWGVLEGPTWSLEINVSDSDPVEAIMLQVHGTGDDVLTVVHRLAGAVGGVVMDCVADELLVEGETAGWHGFQRQRDASLDSAAGSDGYGKASLTLGAADSLEDAFGWQSAPSDLR